MSKISVTLYGPLATQTGISTPSCEVDATGKISLRKVFQLIAERHGQQFVDAVIDPSTGELQPHLHVVVNNQLMQRLQGLDTEVDSDDRIVIMIHILSAMSGG